MAFKLKGFPMHQGTSSFKKETIAAAGGGTEERKGGEREQDTTPRKQKKMVEKRGDLSKMPFGSAERIAEYKRRGWAMDETTRAKPEETKKTVEKKVEKKSNVETGGDAPSEKTKKISEGKTEGATKVEKKELTPKQKRQLKRKERQSRRKAIDAWRRGGSKGEMPQKSNNWGEGSSPVKIYSKPKGKRTKY